MKRVLRGIRNVLETLLRTLCTTRSREVVKFAVLLAGALDQSIERKRDCARWFVWALEIELALFADGRDRCAHVWKATERPAQAILDLLASCSLPFVDWAAMHSLLCLRGARCFRTASTETLFVRLLSGVKVMSRRVLAVASNSDAGRGGCLR
ncbi:unnamed protein product [Ectocarpus sp. 8 AP-2014]